MVHANRKVQIASCGTSTCKTDFGDVDIGVAFSQGLSLSFGVWGFVQVGYPQRSAVFWGLRDSYSAQNERAYEASASCNGLHGSSRLLHIHILIA
jgi:hypothetical protein